MSRSVVLFSLFCGCLAAASGAQEVFAGGRVSFDVPTGFQQLTPQEVARKYPAATSPMQVYATDLHGVSIAYGATVHALRPDQLAEAKDALANSMSSTRSDLQWVSKDVVTINGTRWVHLEFISQAIDSKIHNHLLATSVDGKMVMITFNATVAKYASYKAALDRTRASLRVR